MIVRRTAARRWRVGLTASVAGALLVGVAGGPAYAAGTGSDTPAAAPDPVTVSDVLFDWGINDESTGGSYFGGCNFLSAGVAGDTGSSRLWQQADGFFRASDGATTIVAPTADGTSLTSPTWSTKCTAPDGTSVSGKTNAQAPSNHTAARVQIAGGSGAVDAAARNADIRWTGSFTVVYYGGFTYWSATDPHLVVQGGSGSVTATLSGYAADMDDPSVWRTIPPREVVIAELSDVEVSGKGFTATPRYLGVSIPADVAGRNPQAERTAENEAWWGAFPADFQRFQQLTGQNSYWFTTAGGATTIQPRKVALPLTVTVGAAEPAPVAPAIVTQPVDATAAAGASASFTVEASGRPLAYAWERQERTGAWTPVENGTGATLSVTASNESHGTRYRVIVSNRLGTVTSNEVTLSVASTGGPGDGGGGTSGPVQAAGAVFDWGINNESNGGSYFGGCNFLSAGTAGDAGGARLWKETDGLYRATEGNTTIVRPTAAGDGLAPASWATRCSTPSGASVNGKATNAGDSYTQSRVRITGGTGSFDPAANTASVSWKGSFTVAYYGGMTYWSASDPRLVVKPDGSGTVTVTASGFGADMDDTSKWNRLTPRDVVIATLSGVKVTASGLTVTPDYLGVSIPADVSGRNAQAARTAENEAWWGAFPADFVRFQMETGQSAYWWTTEGSRNSIQPRKMTLPLTVCATADCTVPSQAAAGGASPASLDLRQRAVRAPRAIAAPPVARAAALAEAPVPAAHTVVVVAPAATQATATGLDPRIVPATIVLAALLVLIMLVCTAGGALFATGLLRPPPRS